MSYLHIDNLYKNQEILNFKECYALEKIHGTSAHIGFEAIPNPGLEGDKEYTSEEILNAYKICSYKISFFSGGEKHENFVSLFDKDNLLEKFENLKILGKMTIYGEAYGGKCQKMSETYGKELKFVAFEVKIGECWLNVLKAEGIVKELGLEFVPYSKILTDMDSINIELYKDSEQAMRNGIGVRVKENIVFVEEGKMREGIVLRPLEEYTKNNGERVIVKHKREEFKETSTTRKVTPEQLAVLAEAKEVANEWVTRMRLIHILDKLDNTSIQDTGTVIKTMIEDVKREGEKEIIWSKEVAKAIGKATAILFKEYLKQQLKH